MEAFLTDLAKIYPLGIILLAVLSVEFIKTYEKTVRMLRIMFIYIFGGFLVFPEARPIYLEQLMRGNGFVLVIGTGLVVSFILTLFPHHKLHKASVVPLAVACIASYLYDEQRGFYNPLLSLFVPILAALYYARIFGWRFGKK